MSARTPRVLAAFAGFVLLVASCGGGGGGSSQGYKPPTGPVTETVNVTAGNFSFKPDKLTATAGIARIELHSTGGDHTFVFDGAYPGFFLEVSGSGHLASQKVDLEAGKYTFYCNIPGHRSQGMEGTLTVS